MLSTCYSFTMQVAGTLMCMATYTLMCLNVHGFFLVVMPLLKKRLGVFFGLTWVAVGISLFYNMAWNHFFAMIIKPGCPKDLMDNEQLRKEIKSRENRKAAKVNVDGVDPRGSGAD